MPLEKDMTKKIMIIGGGAAGLMAAIQAARCGASVTILEKNESPGKKILVTGNGRCNLTNLRLDPNAYHGEDPSFAKKAMERFSLKQTLGFFHKAGLMTTDRDGWVYPRSLQASSVLRVLTEEAAAHKVKMKTNADVKDFRPDPDNGWRIITSDWEYQADAVIIACGSAASGQEGTEELLQVLEHLGHRIIKPYPALVPLRCKEKRKWSGVRTSAVVSLYTDERLTASESGEIQLTDYGVSGIPVFQLSRHAVKALTEKKKVYLELDFFPEQTEEELGNWIREQKTTHMDRSLQTILSGCLPDKLAVLLSKEREPVFQAKHFRTEIIGSLPVSSAQVCAGGVSSAQIDPHTMGSLCCRDLYLAGEIIDMDGPCGGYNLQWAWTSGAIAGISASTARGRASL